MVGFCKFSMSFGVFSTTNNDRYIGAKDGIHEFHVNLAGRRKFPSLVLR